MSIYSKYRSTIKQNATYLLVNTLFIVVLLMVFGYSYAFRGNNHPIPALLTAITGDVPPSKGLSESFSEIIRGEIPQARAVNPYGLRVFLFFSAQLLMRILISLYLLKYESEIRKIALTDTMLSLGLFVYCFAPLILYTLGVLF